MAARSGGMGDLGGLMKQAQRMQADVSLIFSWSSRDWSRSRSGGAGVLLFSQGSMDAYWA